MRKPDASKGLTRNVECYALAKARAAYAFGLLHSRAILCKMGTETKLDTFAKYSWSVVVFNLVVILWGVFLRASKSGDGCGQHWLTCHGEVIPSAPELKTIIEYSHRITSAIAFFLVVGLVIWTFRKFAKGSPIRKTAVISFIFIVTEAAVGAGLVLTGNTADTLTAARPFWMAGHMINTFILLAFLVLTARYASGGQTLSFKVERKYLAALAIGVAAIFLVGISGSIAAPVAYAISCRHAGRGDGEGFFTGVEHTAAAAFAASDHGNIDRCVCDISDRLAGQGIGR